MCGLAGVAGNGITTRHRDAYKELLYLSALRGRDSTGVLAVNTRRSPTVHRNYRSLQESSDFINTHGNKEGFLSSGEWNILMGHTRYATVGGVSNRNVHPFDVGPIVGAHNGTLQSLQFYDKKKTDSEMMFEKMVKNGVIPTLSSCSYIDAWAVSIYDKKDKTISLGTNGQRPLSVGIVQNSDVMFWASDYGMIYLVCRRAGIPVECFTLSSYYLYEIDIDEIRSGKDNPWKRHEIERPAVTEYKVDDRFNEQLRF